MMSKINYTTVYAFNKGYRVDTNGNLLSFTGEILKPKMNMNSRYYVNINVKFPNENKISNYFLYVHKLAAYQKFGDKIFEKGIGVRHLNNNCHDNSFDNIDIGTQSQNMHDIPKEKRKLMSIHSGGTTRIFTDEQVKEILNDRKNGMTYNQLCKKYNTTGGMLSYLFNKAYYVKLIKNNINKKEDIIKFLKKRT